MLGIRNPRTSGLKLFSFFFPPPWPGIYCCVFVVWARASGAWHGPSFMMRYRPVEPAVAWDKDQTDCSRYLGYSAQNSSWCLMWTWRTASGFLSYCFSRERLTASLPYTVITMKLCGKVSIHYYSLSSLLVYFSVIYDPRSRLCMSMSARAINWPFGSAP